MEIVMQISNFHHRKGGVWHSIFLGTYHQISEIEKSARETDSFLAGLLFFIFVYHIGFYQLRRNDKSSIAFSFFFLLLFFRIITTGEKLITNYPIFDNFYIYIRMEYLVFFWGPSLGIQFLHYLFPKEIDKRIHYVYYGLSTLATLSLFLKPKYFTFALPILQPFFLLLLIIVPYFLFIKYFKHQWCSSINPNQIWPSLTICITNPNTNCVTRPDAYRPSVSESKACSSFPGNFF